jgi:hypothetical protein
MKPSTILYRVRRPNQTIYFAIYDPGTRRIRTERTEQAANAVADEMGLQLEGEREVTHEQWLRLTGIVPQEEISPQQVLQDSVASLGQPAPRPAPQPQPAPVYELPSAAGLDDPLILKQPVERFSCFSTESLPSEDD